MDGIDRRFLVVNNPFQNVNLPGVYLSYTLHIFVTE